MREKLYYLVEGGIIGFAIWLFPMSYFMLAYPPLAAIVIPIYLFGVWRYAFPPG